MKQFLTVLIGILIYASFPSGDATKHQYNIDVISKNLTTDDWRKWCLAVEVFSQLPEAEKSDAIINEVITWFVTKGESLVSYARQDTVDYATIVTRVVNVLDIIGDLRDPRAFKVFSHLHSYRNLIKYGDDGVLEILEIIEDKPTDVDLAIWFLGESVLPKMGKYSPEDTIRSMIKSKLLYIFEEYPFIIIDGEYANDNRIDVIDALWKFTDDDIVATLDSLSKSNPELKDFIDRALKKNKILRKFLKDGLTEEEENILKSSTCINE